MTPNFGFVTAIFVANTTAFQSEVLLRVIDDRGWSVVVNLILLASVGNAPAVPLASPPVSYSEYVIVIL